MTNLLLRDLAEATGTVGPGWVERVEKGEGVGGGGISHHLLQGDAVIKGDVLLLTSSHVWVYVKPAALTTVVPGGTCLQDFSSCLCFQQLLICARFCTMFNVVFWAQNISNFFH